MMAAPFRHTMRDAAALVERRTCERVAALARFEHGISNAVYFATLANGRECVLRVSPQEDRDYAALEVWAFERCRAVEVPVPAVLTHDLDPPDFPEPYIITERVVGLLGDSADLTLDELDAAYEDLGRQLARIHALEVPGYGDLQRRGETFVGPVASWWERLGSELDTYERALVRHRSDGRETSKLRQTRARFEAHRALFERGAGLLVHGDLQGKNFIVRGGRVAAVLDFECAEAGDPVMDFRVFRYWDDKRDALTRAMLRGYHGGDGKTGADGAFWTRMALYELLYALQRLTEYCRSGNQARIDDAFHRIARIERELDRVLDR